jgi:hypothetical protein
MSPASSPNGLGAFLYRVPGKKSQTARRGAPVCAPFFGGTRRSPLQKPSTDLELLDATAVERLAAMSAEATQAGTFS